LQHDFFAAAAIPATAGLSIVLSANADGAQTTVGLGKVRPGTIRPGTIRPGTVRLGKVRAALAPKFDAAVGADTARLGSQPQCYSPKPRAGFAEPGVQALGGKCTSLELSTRG
jgi:hypothetical protein